MECIQKYGMTYISENVHSIRRCEFNIKMVLRKIVYEAEFG
jgi:hypothetical protein